MARSLAATRGPDGEFVASVNQDVALIGDGNLLGTVGFNNQIYTDLFVSGNGTTAFGQSGGVLDEFDVSSSGVVFLQRLSGVVAGDPAKARGDFIYSADGRRVDMSSMVSATVCTPPVPAQFADVSVGPDPGSDLVYFGAVVDGPTINTRLFNVAACNPESMMTGTASETMVFKLFPGRARGLLPLPNNRLAIRTEEHLVLLDPPAL